MVTRRWLLGAAAAGVAGAVIKGSATAEDGHNGRTVFLTSDDGPNEATSTIIDIAERQQVPIALFMVGTHAAADSESHCLLERAHKSPWITVANHSYSHCASHYRLCYHDRSGLVADFDRANQELGLTSRPVLARGPGRNVWRLPEMRIDDLAIRRGEMAIEDPADDALFAAGYHLYGWDVEWQRRAHGFPRQSSRKMIELLTSPATHTRRSGKLVLLMHDNMVQTAKAAAELTRIIDGVRALGVNFGKITDY
jgi:peptidoglycan/xylan/chitin deacetylase (PgdA/CDA1 family)